MKTIVRTALAGAVGLVCALALGGLGYAATRAVSTSAAPVDSGPVPGTTLSNPATTATTGATSTATNATTPATTTSLPQSKSARFRRGAPGSLSVIPAGGGVATLRWSKSTFASAGTITANPDPRLGVTMTGSGNQLVGVVAATAVFSPLKSLNGALDVVFSGARHGYVPVVSTDGRHFRRLVRLPSPVLSGGVKDGYVVLKGGRIEILTSHLTIFGVLSPANHAKWGDVQHARTKPPSLTLVAGAASGTTVHFTITVDEPVAVVLTAKAGGNKIPISGSSMIGTHRLGGPAAGSKQVNLVRGGRYPVMLVLARTWTGPLVVTLVAGDTSGQLARRTVGFRAP